MTEVGRIALAARAFTIAALVPLATLDGPTYVASTGLVALTAVGAVVVAHRTAIPEWAVALVEAGVVGVLVVLTYPHQSTVTPYLVVPALIGGLDAGRKALWRVVTAEFAVVATVWAVWVQHLDRQMSASLFTWLVTAIGIGEMGVLVRRALTTNGSEESYRSAVALIGRLEALSDKLGDGLDAVGIAEVVMAEADNDVAITGAAVFVPSPGGDVDPLRYSTGTGPDSMIWSGALASACWHYACQVVREHHVALPLRASDEIVAVLVLETVGLEDPRTLEALGARLQAYALPLQAALMFARVREAATTHERTRIAREVHDGVAQDIASLGYLVDNLALASTEVARSEQLTHLRAEVTRIVGELRHSVFDLRHAVASGSGLGETLSAYANRVASLSPMTVHVTVDEKGPRLPPDVERELLRIAQEAMANARKHSGGDNLWLQCRVRAPYAEIQIGDDGQREHSPAVDSQGMKIMRERAAIIGADLEIKTPRPDHPGTRVTVRLDPPRARTEHLARLGVGGGA